MFKNSKEAKERRAVVFQEMETLHAKAVEEKRSFTDDEETSFAAKEKEIQDLDKEIRRLEKMEEMRKQMAGVAGTPVKKDLPEGEKRDIKKFSFLKFIREVSDRNLTGLELEMHQEALVEARDHGVSIKGFGIPYLALSGGESEKRDQTVTAGTQPDDGGALVHTDRYEFIDLLRANLVLRRAGARFITGLQGNFELTNQATGSSFAWETEVSDVDETGITFAAKTLSPKRYGGFIDISRQLIIQSNPSAEQLVREDMAAGMALGLDYAGLYGTGASNQPRGVAATVGIGAVVNGTDGALLTMAKGLEFQSDIEVQNALMGKLAYIGNPSTKYALMNTKLDTGSGKFLMENKDEFLGYPYYSTTQVPNNLTKGSSTSIASGLFFGNWNDLIMAQWGGIDLLVDPYTQGLKSIIRLIQHGFFDVGVRRVQSFSYSADVLTA